MKARQERTEIEPFEGVSLALAEVLGTYPAATAGAGTGYQGYGYQAGYQRRPM